MESICRKACCDKCSRQNECGGCKKTDGHPLGGSCIAAQYIKDKGFDAFCEFKNRIIDEFNALNIENLHVKDLNLLNGFWVNLSYPLANGQSVKLLDDNKVYLGNQIEKPNSDRCYGIVADESYLLVCEYGCEGINPEIILYKKR